jgi:pimeloyl-ACP methyl ester carboxylesterase
MAQIDALGGAEHDFLSKTGGLPAKNQRRVLLKLERCGHSPHRDQAASVVQAVQQFLT